MPESGPQWNEGVSRGIFLSQALRRRSCPGHLIARQSSENAKERKRKKKKEQAFTWELLQEVIDFIFRAVLSVQKS